MRISTAFGFLILIMGVVHSPRLAEAATYHVRADGLGNDANDGSTWNLAFATFQEAIDRANLGGGVGGCSKNAVGATHTIKFAATTGAQSYAPATYVGAIRRNFDFTILGGYDPNTDTQTSTSLIKGTGVANGQTAIFFNNTGCTHGTLQKLTVDRVTISDVTVGIRLQANTGLDNVKPRITMTNVSISSGSYGVYIDWDKRYSTHGPCEVFSTDTTIDAGLDAGATEGDAIRITGPSPQATILRSDLSSAKGSGLLISFMPGASVVTTFVKVTESNCHDCAVDGIHFENKDNASNYAHWEGRSVTITLSKVRLDSNMRHGIYARTFVNSSGGHKGGHINLTANNCLITNNIQNGIHLQGDFFNVNDTSSIIPNVFDCTIANNGGDGIHSVTSHNTSGTHNIRNTIFANNGGDGLDADNNNNSGLTLTETSNNFFNNTGVNLNIHGASVAPDGSDFLVNPYFVNQAPEVFQLLNGSTLLNAGNVAFGPADDLLGVARGAAPSIGAFEEAIDTLEARPSAVPTQIVLGQTFTLSSSPFKGSGVYNSFAWVGPDIPGGQESVEDPGIITPSSTGTKTYSLTTTDSLGVTDTDSVSVTVNPPVTVTLNAFAQNPSLGDVYDLFSTPAGGFPPYTYAWTGPAAYSSTAQNPTNVVPPVIGAAGNLYTLTVTDSLGNTGLANITLFRALTPLTISATAIPDALLIGGTTTLSSSAGGGSGGGFTFSWVGPGAFTSTAQNPGTITPPLGTNAYTVTVTDSFGLTASIAPTLRVVNPVSANPTAAPPVFPIGGSTLLSAAPTGGSGTYVQYVWTGPNGFAFTSSSSPNVTVTPPNAGANDYMLTVTDDLGFSGTATITVFPVTSALTVDAIIQSTIGGIQFNGSTGAVISGESATLSAVVSGGTGQYSFSWTGPNGYTSAVEDPGAVIPTNPVNTYTLTVTDIIAGDSVTDSVTVSVVQEINTQTVSVLPGGMAYRATTISTTERPVDWFKLNVKGLDLNPGDRVNLSIQNSPIGSLNPSNGMVWDGTKRVKGQMGAAPYVFHKCTMAYNAKKRLLRVTCKRGLFGPSGGPALVVQATSGVSDPVPAVIYIDRAPSDGLIDEVVILVGKMRIKARTMASGDRMETGRIIRNRR